MADLGAGLPFAVPEIHNIRTADASDHAGALAYGRNGERYRAVFNIAGASAAAGGFAFYATATAASATADSMSGFVVESATNTNSWAGVWASSVGDDRLGWLQVGGPVTLAFTAAGANVANAIVVPANSTAAQTIAITTDATDDATPALGVFGKNAVGYSASQTSGIVNLHGGAW